MFPSINNYVSYFGIVALIVLYLYFNKKRNYWKTRNVPHRKPILFFGNFLDFFLKPDFGGNFFKKIYNEFEGPYIGFLAFTNPILILKDLDIIKRVLIKDFNSFKDRMPISDEEIDPFLASSLFGMKGDKWKILRSKLSPVFTTGKIKLMLPLMTECGENMVEYFGKNLDVSLEVKSTVSRYTTDVISSCAFGINANSFEREDSEFNTAARKIFPPTFLQNLKALTYFMVPASVRLFKYTMGNTAPSRFLREIFKNTLRNREESNYVRNDLVDTLIKIKNENGDSECIISNSNELLASGVEFFSAGQETTSHLISFAIHELCIHTDIQERLRNDIEDCIAKHGGLTYEAIHDMEYLDMVVSESLRKYSALPFLQRVCNESYVIPETGLKVEKDTIMMILPYALHWDPKYFPNPEIFDPERFNEENKKNIVPYSYMPFGDGPRNCIGERFGLLSSKLGIIYLIRNFQANRNALTVEPLVFSAAALANPRSGFQVTFSKL